ncbi:MAG: peptide-methionine (R)-S-oxide reductase MsrB [Pyrinomonadaceae bacterium]
MNYSNLIVFVVMAAVLPLANCSQLVTSEPIPEHVAVERGNIPVGGAEPESSADAKASDVLIAAAAAAAAPQLVAGQWINSDPLVPNDLRGHVVLLDFWTFGCYNCVNTLPALKRFDAKYRDKGLTIVGIHTPEFDREKVLAALTAAVGKRGIEYPVLTDNESGNWNAFGVEAWPTVIILDKQGRIRYKHVGEGEYDMQENVIKTLLAEKVTSAAASDDEYNGEKVVRTDTEWRASLTPEQYYVLREEGTERAFSGEYNANHAEGDYYCAACHLKLFSSRHKFESGTGWPSFYQPINAKNVTEQSDKSFGVTSTEVECSRCGSHLGHVFDDGPKPTGLRYCMNSVALKFKKKM